MHIDIFETYETLAKEGTLETLSQHKNHFEKLLHRDGFLKQAEQYCYDVILKRITELTNEAKKPENALSA